MPMFVGITGPSLCKPPATQDRRAIVVFIFLKPRGFQTRKPVMASLLSDPTKKPTFVLQQCYTTDLAVPNPVWSCVLSMWHIT